MPLMCPAALFPAQGFECVWDAVPVACDQQRQLVLQRQAETPIPAGIGRIERAELTLVGRSVLPTGHERTLSLGSASPSVSGRPLRLAQKEAPAPKAEALSRLHRSAAAHVSMHGRTPRMPGLSFSMIVLTLCAPLTRGLLTAALCQSLHSLVKGTSKPAHERTSHVIFLLLRGTLGSD